MKKITLIISCLLLCLSCQMKSQTHKTAKKEFSVSKTEEEWKMELTPEQYYVLQNAGTEKPFSSKLLNLSEEGSMFCAACGNLLFENEYQYDANCGWPSFDRAVEGSVVYQDDFKLGYKRTEVLCAQCGGHLGHVFHDGPRETTGVRYCINGVALDFKSEKEIKNEEI